MHSGRKFFNPKLLVEMEGSIIVGCPLCNRKCVEMRRKKESHAHTHSPCLAGLGGTGRAMTRRGEAKGVDARHVCKWSTKIRPKSCRHATSL
jgi:hypothetical protein